MLPNIDLTSDEILAKLDQTSKKTRTISIVLTLLLLLILVIIVFLTFKAAQNLTDLNTQAEEVSKTTQALRKEKAELEKTINEAKASIANNPNCVEAEKILDNADTDIQPTKMVTPTTNPLKTPNVTSSPTTTPVPSDTSPSTVYVQIVEKTQRDSAKKIIQALAGGNFKFPGIELVERKVAQTQVRYFREEDKTRANELVGKLIKQGIPATAVSPYKTNSSLEIWFANDAFNK